MSKSLFFFIVLIIASFIFGQLFCQQIEGYETASFVGRLAVSSHFLIDFLFITAVIVFLVNGSLISRIAGYMIFTVLILVYSLQYVSIYLTGDYLSALAIDNIQHIGLILTTSKIMVAGSLCVFLLVMTATAEHYLQKTSWTSAGLMIVCCLFITALLKTDELWLSKDTLSTRASLLNPEDRPVRGASPIRALIQSWGQTRQSSQKIEPMTDAEQKAVSQFGITYNEKSFYPFIKDDIYRSELPFPETRQRTDSNPAPNIIVFLSEGLSTRVMQPYNNQYPGLTPNIARFAESAMRVDNYYNHTFATYRGLLGQLCSIFPIYAGGQISHKADYYCLGDLLKEEGYETYFLFSQQKQNTSLDEVLAKTNIEHIYAQDDLRRLHLENEPANRPLALSDQQFIRATIGQLRLLEHQQQTGETTPFFMGLYNIETHAFNHIGDDGVKYTGQDHYVLDSIHNYDNAFGKFWQHFKQSGLFENTIVIFTADHAHFQGKDFSSLVKNQRDYQYQFVDRMPLLIYHPGLELPTSFDAMYASSLDLAPSIAHLMKLENRSNSFLGQSIFERTGKEGLAFGEGHIYIIGKDGIKIQNQYLTETDNDSKINNMYKIIGNMHTLEKQGRVWNPEMRK